MIYVARCPKGAKFVYAESLTCEVVCPDCGETHEGEPTSFAVLPNANVIGDELRPHFDWSAGVKITSKSQRRKVYAEKGLNLSSVSEYRRKHGGMERTASACSYAGQTNHKSAAERRQVV